MATRTAVDHPGVTVSRFGESFPTQPGRVLNRSFRKSRDNGKQKPQDQKRVLKRCQVGRRVFPCLRPTASIPGRAVATEVSPDYSAFHSSSGDLLL